MTTLHVELDEAIVAEIRETASRVGKTAEALAAEILTEQARGEKGREALRRFLKAAETSSGNATGWKWNRDELYGR